MKRFLLTLAVTALTLFSADAAEKTKTYDFGDITGISAGGVYQIHVTYGKSDKVKVVYDSDIEDYVKPEIRYFSGSLVLTTKQNKPFKNWTRSTEIHVYLEMDEISEIELSGAAKADFSGRFKTDRLELDLSGAAGMNSLIIDGQALEADLSGAANADMTGNFSGKAELDMSGASNIRWKGNAASLEAEISGASKLNCTGDFKSCDISCSGASNADLSGKTTAADYECSGASSIDAEKMFAKTASVELTGASKAHVYASDRLDYNVSRSSKMTYYGDAQLHNMSTDSNVVRGR